MPSKVDIWMPLYIGDILADTSHLDAERFGCYMLWLMHYWRKGPLGNDVLDLVAIGKLRRKDAPSIAQALLDEFFAKEDDGKWHQKRADIEISKWQDKSLIAKEKAQKAAQERWKNHTTSNAPSIPTSNAQAMLEPCPSTSPLTSSSNTTTTTEETKKQKHLARSVPPEELAGTLPLVGDGLYGVSKSQVTEWSQAFPGVDVKLQLKKFKVWLDANPTRRKTQKGICRAIVNWLSRAQDKSPATSTGGNGYANGNGNKKSIVESQAAELRRSIYGDDPDRIQNHDSGFAAGDHDGKNAARRDPRRVGPEPGDLLAFPVTGSV